MTASTSSPLPHPPTTVAGSSSAPGLRELLEDGIYLLFLLKDDNPPGSAGEFNQRVDAFLNRYESNARNFGKDPQQTGQAKFAFCALMDEIILSSEFALRTEWEGMPLQLRLFGEHLAGESFFTRLEQLRLNPELNLEALEVYYTCLLLGFKGKYLLEGEEKLGYLTQKLAQEIQSARGGRAEFAPNWRLPQRFQSFVRHQLPLWLYFALLALAAAAIFGAYRWVLAGQINTLLGISA